MIFIAQLVVKHISDRIAVMYLGKHRRDWDRQSLYQSPKHPHTQALVSAVPIPDPANHLCQRIAVTGELPSPMNPPQGCAFNTRCPLAVDKCQAQAPSPETLKTGDGFLCFEVDTQESG
ncbi:MAG: hypothetical protein R3B54_02815 [Bdellovibrionota bacterium]